MGKKGYSIAGFALLVFAFGCAETEPSADALGSKQEAIWNGQADTGAAMNGYRNAVVRLTNTTRS